VKAVILGALLLLSLAACGSGSAATPSEFTLVRDLGEAPNQGWANNRAALYRHVSGRCFLYVTLGHAGSMAQVDKEMCEVPR
jgi:hypothetical protein